jgi:DNA-directed RNA polymerase subunit omega
MARITVQDCMAVVPNRFELSGLAGYLAKEISRGRAVVTPKQDNDKNTVMALREIAEGNISVTHLRDLYLRSLQKHAQADDVLEEDTHNIAAETTDEQLQPTKSIVPEEETGETYISVDDYAFEGEDNLDE